MNVFIRGLDALPPRREVLLNTVSYDYYGGVGGAASKSESLSNNAEKAANWANNNETERVSALDHLYSDITAADTAYNPNGRLLTTREQIEKQHLSNACRRDFVVRIGLSSTAEDDASTKRQLHAHANGLYTSHANTRLGQAERDFADTHPYLTQPSGSPYQPRRSQTLQACEAGKEEMDSATATTATHDVMVVSSLQIFISKHDPSKMHKKGADNQEQASPMRFGERGEPLLLEANLESQREKKNLKGMGREGGSDAIIPFWKDDSIPLQIPSQVRFPVEGCTSSYDFVNKVETALKDRFCLPYLSLQKIEVREDTVEKARQERIAIEETLQKLVVAEAEKIAAGVKDELDKHHVNRKRRRKKDIMEENTPPSAADAEDQDAAAVNAAMTFLEQRRQNQMGPPSVSPPPFRHDDVNAVVPPPPEVPSSIAKLLENARRAASMASASARKTDQPQTLNHNHSRRNTVTKAVDETRSHRSSSVSPTPKLVTAPASRTESGIYPPAAAHENDSDSFDSDEDEEGKDATTDRTPDAPSHTPFHPLLEAKNTDPWQAIDRDGSFVNIVVPAPAAAPLMVSEFPTTNGRKTLTFPEVLALKHREAFEALPSVIEASIAPKPRSINFIVTCVMTEKDRRLVRELKAVPPRGFDAPHEEMGERNTFLYDSKNDHDGPSMIGHGAGFAPNPFSPLSSLSPAVDPNTKLPSELFQRKGTVFVKTIDDVRAALSQILGVSNSSIKPHQILFCNPQEHDNNPRKKQSSADVIPCGSSENNFGFDFIVSENAGLTPLKHLDLNRMGSLFGERNGDSKGQAARGGGTETVLQRMQRGTFLSDTARHTEEILSHLNTAAPTNAFPQSSFASLSNSAATPSRGAGALFMADERFALSNKDGGSALSRGERDVSSSSSNLRYPALLAYKQLQHVGQLAPAVYILCDLTDRKGVVWDPSNPPLLGGRSSDGEVGDRSAVATDLSGQNPFHVPSFRLAAMMSDGDKKNNTKTDIIASLPFYKESVILGQQGVNRRLTTTPPPPLQVAEGSSLNPIARANYHDPISVPHHYDRNYYPSMMMMTKGRTDANADHQNYERPDDDIAVHGVDGLVDQHGLLKESATLPIDYVGRDTFPSETVVFKRDFDFDKFHGNARRHIAPLTTESEAISGADERGGGDGRDFPANDAPGAPSRQTYLQRPDQIYRQQQPPSFTLSSFNGMPPLSAINAEQATSGTYMIAYDTQVDRERRVRNGDGGDGFDDGERSDAAVFAGTVVGDASSSSLAMPPSEKRWLSYLDSRQRNTEKDLKGAITGGAPTPLTTPAIPELPLYAPASRVSYDLTTKTHPAAAATPTSPLSQRQGTIEDADLQRRALVQFVLNYLITQHVSAKTEFSETELTEITGDAVMRFRSVRKTVTSYPLYFPLCRSDAQQLREIADAAVVEKRAFKRKHHENSGLFDPAAAEGESSILRNVVLKTLDREQPVYDPYKVPNNALVRANLDPHTRFALTEREKYEAEHASEINKRILTPYSEPHFVINVDNNTAVDEKGNVLPDAETQLDIYLQRQRGKFAMHAPLSASKALSFANFKKKLVMAEPQWEQRTKRLVVYVTTAIDIFSGSSSTRARIARDYLRTAGFGGAAGGNPNGAPLYERSPPPFRFYLKTGRKQSARQNQSSSSSSFDFSEDISLDALFDLGIAKVHVITHVVPITFSIEMDLDPERDFRVLEEAYEKRILHINTLSGKFALDDQRERSSQQQPFTAEDALRSASPLSKEAQKASASLTSSTATQERIASERRKFLTDTYSMLFNRYMSMLRAAMPPTTMDAVIVNYDGGNAHSRSGGSAALDRRIAQTFRDSKGAFALLQDAAATASGAPRQLTVNMGVSGINREREEGAGDSGGPRSQALVARFPRDAAGGGLSSAGPLPSVSSASVITSVLREGLPYTIGVDVFDSDRDVLFRTEKDFSIPAGSGLTLTLDEYLKRAAEHIGYRY